MRRTPRAQQASTILALGCCAVGIMTGFEHITGLDLGIDQLLAPTLADGRGRMPVSVAASLVVLGLSIEGAKSRVEQVSIAAELAAAGLLLFNAFALLGYLYDVSFLYRPTQFIRSSPYGSFARGCISMAILAMRPELGVTRRFLGSTTGARSIRALLPAVVLLPVVLGGILIAAERADLTSTATGTALLVISLIVLLTAVVTSLGHSLDAIDRQRSSVEADLRRYGELTAALANAGTIEEVVRATMAGLPALGASAGSVAVITGNKRELELVASQGYPEEMTENYARIPIDAAIPICEAVRTHAPVFIDSPEERSKRFPALDDAPTSSKSWAALPLESGDRVIGALVLSFTERSIFDDATRARLTNLANQCGQALDRALLFELERQARRTAEDASRVKDEFLAILGHELRNPLAPILTSLALMKLRGGDQFARERAVIERQAHHLARLVDDLLDVSRVTRGKIELRRQRVDIADAVAAAIETVSPLLEQRGHRLDVTTPTQSLFVNGDPERLKQVLSNLLSNASKYTEPAGRVSIIVAAEGEQVVIRVRDTGAGLSPELLPRVFEMFVQGQRTLERSEGGLGLGLAIVRSLVEAHGGSVEAQSEGLGRGSEFIVRLPADKSQPRETSAQPRTTRRGAVARDGTRILVVDDNADAADLLAEALREAGHQVRVAYDGPAALEVAGEFRPALVFLDIGLPAMDGYEVARRMRSESWGRGMKIVAVTGYGQAGDRDRAAAAGFNRHLVKPVELRVTLEVAAEVARTPQDATWN
jgi:signal transduction histidine kinase/ActR/RegA family two-component response regulator